jgi:hypothetical protein
MLWLDYGTAHSMGRSAQVFVRVRPLSGRERELGGHKCVQQPDARSVRVLTSEQPTFTFDTVAGEAADQAGFFAGARTGSSHSCSHACMRRPLDLQAHSLSHIRACMRRQEPAHIAAQAIHADFVWLCQSSGRSAHCGEQPRWLQLLHLCVSLPSCSMHALCYA